MLESFFDDHEEQLFIVQDFCDGGTLQDCITAAKSVSAKNCKKLVGEGLVAHCIPSPKCIIKDVHPISKRSHQYGI